VGDAFGVARSPPLNPQRSSSRALTCDVSIAVRRPRSDLESSRLGGSHIKPCSFRVLRDAQHRWLGEPGVAPADGHFGRLRRVRTPGRYRRPSHRNSMKILGMSSRIRRPSGDVSIVVLSCAVSMVRARRNSHGASDPLTGRVLTLGFLATQCELYQLLLRRSLGDLGVGSPSRRSTAQGSCVPVWWN
jgi:hypothetical protein